MTGAGPAELQAIANYDLRELTLERLIAIDTALILWDWDYSCRPSAEVPDIRSAASCRVMT